MTYAIRTSRYLKNTRTAATITVILESVFCPESAKGLPADSLYLRTVVRRSRSTAQCIGRIRYQAVLVRMSGCPSGLGLRKLILFKLVRR